MPPRNKTKSEKKGRFWWQIGVIWGLMVLLAWVYWEAPVGLAGITVFPFWSWACLLILGTVRMPWKEWGKTLMAWGVGLVIFAALTGEEVRCLVRGGFEGGNVAVLNCAGGQVESGEEALESGAELVLLQETPSEESLRRVVGEGWDVLAGPDGAILVKGEIVEGSELELVNATMATVRFESGSLVNVVSLRLQPPVFRVDVYSSEYWEAYRLNLTAREEELTALLAVIEEHFGGYERMIIAGDFNAPRTQKLWESVGVEGFRDAVDVAGRGWPGSAVNDFAFVRIDHMYVSDDLVIEGAGVRKTKTSDHRMVLARIEF